MAVDSSIYGRYAVDAVELGPVEIGLHIGALNAAVGVVWSPDGFDAAESFDIADEMVREFRRRTDTADNRTYRRLGNLDVNHEWLAEHGDDHPDASRVLNRWMMSDCMDATFSAREIRDRWSVTDAAIRALVEGGQIHEFDLECAR